MLEGSENAKEAEGEGEGLSEAEQKALLRMSLEEVCVCVSCLSPCHSTSREVWASVCVLRRVADALLLLHSVECMW